jgi:phosphoribosylformylglycinamidine synthase
MVTLLEMAFTGDCGLNLTFDVNGTDFNNSVVPFLFNEELGLVFEVHNTHLDAVVKEFKTKSVPVVVLGDTTVEKTINFVAGKSSILHDSMVGLRDIWEATSFELEMRQKNPKCIVQEKVGLKSRKAPPLKLSFTPKTSVESLLKSPASRPRIAVLREEGSNGDREMIAAWHMAGFDVFDVKMSDFTASDFSLKSFRGVAFVGGFSYADVLGSAKGWAGVTRFNEKTFREFNDFYSR